jgi:hypothetical protein
MQISSNAINNSLDIEKNVYFKDGFLGECQTSSFICFYFRILCTHKKIPQPGLFIIQYLCPSSLRTVFIFTNSNHHHDLSSTFVAISIKNLISNFFFHTVYEDALRGSYPWIISTYSTYQKPKIGMAERD